MGIAGGLSTGWRKPAEMLGVRASVAWREVFHPERIERLKKLLDDPQSRLNAGGVAVVREQLDTWCREVPRRIEVRDLRQAAHQGVSSGGGSSGLRRAVLHVREGSGVRVEGRRVVVRHLPPPAISA